MSIAVSMDDLCSFVPNKRSENMRYLSLGRVARQPLDHDNW
jgi:hypothetical protein